MKKVLKVVWRLIEAISILAGCVSGLIMAWYGWTIHKTIGWKRVCKWLKWSTNFMAMGKDKMDEYLDELEEELKEELEDE